MTSRLLRRAEPLGCLGAVALGLLLMGSLALVSELQSPTAVLWTGRPVMAQDRGGVVQYSVNRANYALIIGSEPANTPAHTVTVYFDPNNPSVAQADSAATRWFEGVFVAAPFLAAMAVIIAGLARNRRRRRTRAARGPTGDELLTRRQRVRHPWADPPDRPA